MNDFHSAGPGLSERYLWNKLDPKTQEWLRAPGGVIRSRSVTETLLRASDEQDRPDQLDRHGQFLLSPRDQDFLKSIGATVPVGHPVPPGTPWR